MGDKKNRRLKEPAYFVRGSKKTEGSGQQHPKTSLESANFVRDSGKIQDSKLPSRAKGRSLGKYKWIGQSSVNFVREEKVVNNT